MAQMPEKQVVVIGAGPAGLTAAYELCKADIASVVIEKDDVVGGLARTVNYKDYLFDIGGHRFFTKVHAVEAMWREVLSEQDFLRCQRLSRIYYNKKFFYYPLRVANALFGLEPWNCFLILLSYLWAQLFPVRPEESFEAWVSNRFGKRLYRIFFKTYTEKVWGIPCSEIRAEWAAQRIKGLSLLTALKGALFKQPKRQGTVIKTLIDAFDYPARGPGMMWETVAEMIQQRGSELLLDFEVHKIHWTEGQVQMVECTSQGHTMFVHGTDFISSMPIQELIQKFAPPVPAAVLRAALQLHYRDFITVALVVNKATIFPDNWIYVHDPGVKLGRIQNFKNWSPHMVPDATKTCLGLEYFCFEGDGLWMMPDEELIALGKRELAKIGLVQADDVIDGAVVRMPKAYPVYDAIYAESLQTVRQFLGRIGNLQLVGRNGMHKYNNQDHSMLTAMLAVKNILGAHYDLWQVNTDQAYHEEIRQDTEADTYRRLQTTQPLVPESLVQTAHTSVLPVQEGN